MPDWKQWYKKADTIPFDFAHGPLIKICAVMGNNRTEIVVLGHHILGDGTGYLNLVKDILSALDSKIETSPQIPPANNKFVKGKNIGLLPRLYAKTLNNAWRKHSVHFSENDYLEFFRDYSARFTSAIYMDSINEDNLKQLLELCKANKLTVNELLTSAFAVAFAAGKKLRIGVVASTRGELTTQPYYCMGNYLTGISVKEHYASANDFMSSVKRTTKVLRKKLTDVQSRHAVVNFLGEFDHDLLESIVFASYGNYQLPISKKIGIIIEEGFDSRGLGISNLGRHEINNYNKFRLLDLQFIGPIFPANILSVCVLTVNNRLNICLGYTETEIEKNTVCMIYKKAMELLFSTQP